MLFVFNILEGENSSSTRGIPISYLSPASPKVYMYINRMWTKMLLESLIM